LDAKRDGHGNSGERLIRDLVARKQPEVRLPDDFRDLFFRCEGEPRLGTFAELGDLTILDR
jgi:hypothetical protein